MGWKLFSSLSLELFFGSLSENHSGMETLLKPEFLRLTTLSENHSGMETDFPGDFFQELNVLSENHSLNLCTLT